MSGPSYVKKFPHLKENSLLGKLYSFLKANHKGGKLLLALSGGPDSLALFYLLREYQQYAPFKFSCAHVNHRLRKESDREEEILKSLCEKAGIDLYTRQLEPLEGNFEAEAREKRLSFFGQLTAAEGFEATLFGHHGDDLAETTLKRLFEGANLSSLGGMQKISVFEKVTLWRPLLSFSKSDLCDYLETLEVKPFIDETNFDENYLRARMRGSLIPQLSKQFGKSIRKNLSRLSEEAYELKELLDFLTEGLLREPLTLDETAPPLLKRHLIRRFLEKKGVVASREQLKEILTPTTKAKREWIFKKGTLKIERGVISWLRVID